MEITMLKVAIGLAVLAALWNLALKLFGLRQAKKTGDLLQSARQQLQREEQERVDDLRKRSLIRR